MAWYTDLSSDPLAWVSGLGTLAGLGGGIYNAIGSMSGYNALKNQANKPLDIDRYYKPMTDAMQAAARRAWMAGAVTRGLPPEMAERTFAYEIAPKLEQERWNQAAQIALQNRQGVLGAYSRYPTVPGMGDTSAFGNYLASQKLALARQQSDAQNAAFRREYLDLLRSQMPTQVSSASPGFSPDYTQVDEGLGPAFGGHNNRIGMPDASQFGEDFEF